MDKTQNIIQTNKKLNVLQFSLKSKAIKKVCATKCEVTTKNKFMSRKLAQSRAPVNKLKTKLLMKKVTQNFLLSPNAFERSPSQLDLSLMFKQNTDSICGDECQENTCFDNFGEVALKNLKQCTCEQDTQMDDMLFSDEEDEDSEPLQKMDTGLSAQTEQYLHSLSKPQEMSNTAALDEFLLDSADSLRSCFSKQFNLTDTDAYLRHNSAK